MGIQTSNSPIKLKQRVYSLCSEFSPRFPITTSGMTGRESYIFDYRVNMSFSIVNIPYGTACRER